MNRDVLERTASELVASGKGILAADESSGTIKKRFDRIGVESTEETRRAYREILFTADGVEKHISGVILFDETIRQSTSERVPFPALLASRGIVPGIKVDKGAKDLAGFPGATSERGLRSGARSLPSAMRFRRPRACAPTDMLWRDTQRSARRRASCPSWSPRS
jgi:fructose-bisphosphate aldolase class I